jgi:hypothetical protein
MKQTAWISFVLVAAIVLMGRAAVSNETAIPAELKARLKQELAAKYGEPQRARIERGIEQAAGLWKPEDGNGQAFAAFVRENFIADPARLNETFQHFEYAFEQIDGYLNEMTRELRHWMDLDAGPLLPADRIFAAYDPSAHVVEDLFANKAGFIVLLNFPLTTLEERLKQGPGWTRRQWAEVRLAQRFSKRVPPEINQKITTAYTEGESYIGEYNIWMHHLVDAPGRRLFPSGLRLISHWNLRDELKADYSGDNGLAKQQMIAKVMERIVTQTIPRAVIDNPRVDWAPYANTVRPAPADTVEPNAPPEGQRPGSVSPAPEPDTRYAHLLATFHAVRLADPYSPSMPTHIARRFEESREMPEARVEQLFKDVLTSPAAPRIARLIEQRLGRKLEPFDIWYNGFQPRGKYTEAELDAIVAKKYPNVAAYQADIPRLLEGLGFAPERAKYLAGRIVVDPSRGAGHAMAAQRRGDKPHLRTRFEQGGMNYKGYNIAIHEMGHNVEQIFSLYDVDHTLLSGVPNTAFTEALAFVFQARDLELLGLAKPDAESERLRVLDDFWTAYEICGPALVDMAVWHWMYGHPKATPAELREATVGISKDIWNRYYAPVFGRRDVVLLGVYSHMVNLMMYLPDYPLGCLIAFQIEEQIRKGRSLGEEFERMASYGAVAPDLWMEHATGKPVSAEPLLRATEAALK